MEHIIRECLAFTLLFVLMNNPSESNLVLDLRFWTLLQSILLSKSPKTGFDRNTWLIPLLNRVPLLPIVSSLLSNSLNLPKQERVEVYFQPSKCLTLVWPLAAPKFSLDGLLECFGAVLRVLGEDFVQSDKVSGLIEICMLVTSSMHNVLSYSSNKKKVCLPSCRFFLCSY